MKSLKVLVAGYQHETNTFAPTKADWAAFNRGDSFPAFIHGQAMLDKLAGITRADLLAVAHGFSIRAPERILDEVDAAVTGWPGYAKETAVPAADVARISAALDARRRELGR